jgi:hypothetical protein
MVRRGFLGGLTYASRRGDFAGNADLPDFETGTSRIPLTVSSCLLGLLSRANSTNLLTRYLPYPAHPTVVPSVRHTNSLLPCV